MKWTSLEKALLFFSVLTIIIVGVVSKSDLLTIICPIVGVIAVLLIAKGQNLGQVFGTLIAILYSIVSFQNKYYGEVLIYGLILFPMHIIGIITWINHKSKKTDFVEINVIKKREWITILTVFPVVFIGIYYLLKYFNTNELLVSTISVITGLFAVYLQIRRSRYSFSFYLINDIILIALWGLPIIHGKYTLLPMLFDPIINFINDLYGFYNWKKMELLQK